MLIVQQNQLSMIHVAWNGHLLQANHETAPEFFTLFVLVPIQAEK